MIVVLDPSAAAEIVLNRRHAKELAESLKEADWVISPQLYAAEITNIFWKYYQFQDLPKDICEKGIEKSLELVEELFNEEELCREAFAMACLMKHSVYDMLYLVLARRHDALLMTLDEKLERAAKKQSIKTVGNRV